LTAVFVAAQTLSSPFWGWLSDRLGHRKWFFLGGALATLLCFLILGVSKILAMVHSDSEDNSRLGDYGANFHGFVEYI